LDLAGNLALHLRWCDAGIRHSNDDGRELDVRPVLHAEPREAQEAGDGERDEKHHDRNGIPDRPGDKVHTPVASTTSTRSPSFKNPAPRRTMRSPERTPDVISIRPSFTGPISIRRRSTRPSPPIT